MYALLKKLAERRAALRPPRQVDPEMIFSRRDWADLPRQCRRTERD